MISFPKYLPSAAFLFSTLFLLIFSWSTSPLYLTYGGDSPFFQLIGLGITQGKVPYVDLFDHKGPIPFFINALGYSFGIGRYGIFILQTLSLSVTLCLIYRLAGLFVTTVGKAVAAVALTMLPLIDFITEGNQVEEWELPFVALSLLLSCRYLKTYFSQDASGAGKRPGIFSFVLGLCFAMVFYIRPNDGVMWIGSLFFGLFLLWVTKRDWESLWKNISAFVAGAIVVSVPVFGYFIAHNAVPDLIYGMIIHNVRYAGDALFTWGGVGMILIPAAIIGFSLLLFKREGHKEFFWIFIPMLVTIILFIGKRDYYHYLIPFIPFISICFAQCIRAGQKIFLCVVCSLFAIFSFQEFRFIAKAVSLRPVLKTFYEQSDALFDAVPEEERNNVWNYNLVSWEEDDFPHLVNMMACFLHKGITPAGAILAAYDLTYLESTQGIRAHSPKWVVMCPTDAYNKDFDYIYENYELVASSPSEPVCELRLYRRK